jgi:hypothetical protein
MAGTADAFRRWLEVGSTMKHSMDSADASLLKGSLLPWVVSSPSSVWRLIHSRNKSLYIERGLYLLARLGLDGRRLMEEDRMILVGRSAPQRQSASFPPDLMLTLSSYLDGKPNACSNLQWTTRSRNHATTSASLFHRQLHVPNLHFLGFLQRVLRYHGTAQVEST